MANVLTVKANNRQHATDCINICTHSEIKVVAGVEADFSYTTIGDGAFYGCSSLRSLTIPSSVTSIEDPAFSGCSVLISITIPSSVSNLRVRCTQ